MDVIAAATRTWRLHAAADFGDTEKARERAARVRDGVAQTLRTACAEHMRITILSRFAFPPRGTWSSRFGARSRGDGAASRTDRRAAHRAHALLASASHRRHTRRRRDANDRGRHAQRRVPRRAVFQRRRAQQLRRGDRDPHEGRRLYCRDLRGAVREHRADADRAARVARAPRVGPRARRPAHALGAGHRRLAPCGDRASCPQCWRDRRHATPPSAHLAAGRSTHNDCRCERSSRYTSKPLGVGSDRSVSHRPEPGVRLHLASNRRSVFDWSHARRRPPGRRQDDTRCAPRGADSRAHRRPCVDARESRRGTVVRGTCPCAPREGSR